MWEISGSLRAKAGYGGLRGQIFSPDCGRFLSGVMSLFAAEFTSLFTISLTFIRTRICASYGGNAHEGSVWFV